MWTDKFKNELILPEDTAQGYQSSIRFYFLSAMLHSRRPSDISQHICQHSKSQAIALDHNKIHDQDQTKLKQKNQLEYQAYHEEPVLFEKIRNLLILKTAYFYVHKKTVMGVHN